MKAISKLFAICALCAVSATGAQAERVVILHTNDTHSRIDPGADGFGGVARRKVVIDSVRAAEKNVILVDAGDVVQGSLFFNVYKGELEEKLMNALGYDIRILGNHEFDNGMEDLAKNLLMSDASLLCTNYKMRGTPLEGIFQPWTYQEIDGKRIAFMPINLEPKGMISDSNVVGMGYVDAKETANKTAWYLKNVEDMDYVIAVTHIGHGPDTDLIKSSTDIDALIGGHSHTLVDPSDPKTPSYLVKNAAGRDIPVVQTGRYGSYIGELVIDLDDAGAVPQYKLIRVDSRLDGSVDPAIETIIQPYRSAVDSLNHNYIATVARDLPQDSPDLLNFMADFVDRRGRELDPGLDLAIINRGGIRRGLQKGKVAEGDIMSLMPFFNTIQVIEIQGDSLQEAFNTMAKIGGNGVGPNVDAVFNPDTDICTQVTISGKPIDPNKTYKIATIDYLANGGDYMHSLVDHKVAARSDKYLFEDLVQYLKQGKIKKINPSSKKRMRPE